MTTYHPIFSLGSAVLALVFITGASFAAGTRHSATNGQSSDSDEIARAISLYKQEQNEEAITILREVVRGDKRNLRAWHYLGLALQKKGDPQEAQKAHDKAARLGDELLESRIDQVRGFDDFTNLLRPISNELFEAAESARRYLQLEDKPSRSKRLDWNLLADSLQSFAEIANADLNTQPVFKGTEVDAKARILSRPLPSYTDEARRARVSGTIVLKAILAANGKVIGISPLTTLPNGLTAKAIRAAQLIEFLPALKNGKPVSMYVQIEYSFNTY